MSVKNQSETEHSGGILGGVIGAVIIIAICVLVFYHAFIAVFYDYSIYYKDEVFLSNAKTVHAQVTKRYIDELNKNVYEFHCGRKCHEQYSEKKRLRLKYEIDGKGYENDMLVVDYHNVHYYKMEQIPLPGKGDEVDIYYNAKDPNDIRLQNDIMIKKLNDGSWFDRHGHWMWIVLWGILGIVSLGVVFIMLVPILGWIVLQLQSKDESKASK